MPDANSAVMNVPLRAAVVLGVLTLGACTPGPSPDVDASQPDGVSLSSSRALPADVMRNYLIEQAGFDPVYDSSSSGVASVFRDLSSSDAWDGPALRAWFDALDGLAERWARPDVTPPRLRANLGELLPISLWSDFGESGGDLNAMFDSGRIEIRPYIPVAGTWKLQVEARAPSAGMLQTLDVYVDGTLRSSVNVPDLASDTPIEPVWLELPEGDTRISFGLRGAPSPAATLAAARVVLEESSELTLDFALFSANPDFQVMVGAVELVGPLAASPASPLCQARALSDAECAADAVSHLAARAWRVPVDHEGCDQSPGHATTS